MANPFDQSLIAPWGANTAKEYATAVGGQIAGSPAQFGNALANMYNSYNQGYGTYNQGLAGLGNSYAQNYGAFAGGVGQLANALGNTWNNAQANNPYASSAEAARQMGVAQMGSAALGAYGNIGVAGMDAWARNQNGYQQALAGMASANQNAVSGLGQARYGALANLGNATAKYGVGSEVAGQLPGLFSDMGFGGGGSGGGGWGGGGGYGALDALRQDINSTRDADQLQGGYEMGMGSLNYDQALARNYPRQQINDSFGHLMTMNRMNLDESRRGMDQFYANYGPYQGVQTREGQIIPTGSLLDALTGGYADSAGRISGSQDDMRSGWSDASGAYGSSTAGVRDLFDSSVGKLFMSPLESQRQSFQMQDERAARRAHLAELNGGIIIGVPWNYR